jgi:hypothetical protein
MNMRTQESKSTCLFALLLLLFLAQGCDSDRQTNMPDPSASTGALVGQSGCGGYALSAAVDTLPNNKSCIEYEYVGDSILYLRHVNAGFNCCPLIAATVAVEGDEIAITESESLPGGGCRCLCLFDLDYEIHDVEPGVFTIFVEELYLRDGDEPLQFTVDLSESKSGVFCVERGHYPWQESEAPSGGFVDLTGCKPDGWSITASADTIDPNQSCIVYNYTEDMVLHMQHVNAVFNCCPVMDWNITISGNVITVEEIEVEGLCDCICLFDVEFEISDLLPGNYQINFIEPYWHENYNKLEFSIDLSTSSSGTYCVDRGSGIWLGSPN